MIFVRYKADVTWWGIKGFDKRFTINKLNRVTKNNLYLFNYMIFDDGYFVNCKSTFDTDYTIDDSWLGDNIIDLEDYKVEGQLVFEEVSKEEFCLDKSQEDIKTLDLVVELLETKDPSNMEIARIMYNKLNWNGKIKKINNSTI